MLAGMREHATGFLAKALLFLLVLSFAAWGIEDIFRHGNEDAVATVDGVRISRAQYERVLSREIETLRRYLPGSDSQKILQDPAIRARVLRNMIEMTLLRKEAASLGIIPGDHQVLREIKSTPAFQNNEAQFDREIFQNTLRNIGLSEAEFIEQLNDNIAISMLKETLAGIPLVSDQLAQHFYELREETRVADLLWLPENLVQNLPAPDESALAEYHSRHAKEFKAPEYRTASYLYLSAKEVEGAIDESDLQRAYRERLEELKTPEKRKVEQLLFDSEKDAKAAHDALQKGKNFQAAAKEFKILNPDSVALGTLKKSEILEGAEETVFSLKESEFSAPFKSPFGWHLFRVAKIEPAVTPSFEEARPQLVKALAQRLSEEKIYRLVDQLEDELAGGATLEEAALKFKLTVKKLSPVNAQGKTPDGGIASDIPPYENFLKVLFSLEERAESPLTHGKNGDYFIIRADSLIPERQRALDEVRGLVISGWEKETRAKKLESLADEAAKKLSAGEALSTLKTAGMQVLSSGPLKRDSVEFKDNGPLSGVKLPAGFTAELFRLEMGKSGKVFAVKGKGLLIPVLRKEIPASQASLSAEEKEKNLQEIRNRLENDYRAEIYQQYLRYLESKYPVSIDEQAVKHSQE